MFLILATDPSFRCEVSQKVDVVLSHELDFRLLHGEVGFIVPTTWHLAWVEGQDPITTFWPECAFAGLMESMVRNHVLSHGVAVPSSPSLPRLTDRKVLDLWLFDIQVSTLTLDDISGVVDDLFGAALLAREVSMYAY